MIRKSALIVVDVQNDFCPRGALAVPEGDRVVPVINRAIELFRAKGLPILASRDWHPAETSHFKAFGGVWPVHCVKGTEGAAFHPDLRLPDDAIVVSKGMDPRRDDYSAFMGVAPDGTPPAELLRRLGVTEIFVGGLATDYCVKETVLAGLREGFRVVLLEDAARGVDLQPGDSERAIAAMKEAGAETADVTKLEKDDSF